jgi:antitoxin (DNA-binding transcriptional repressor) of toxin-antitoxin stability system
MPLRNRQNGLSTDVSARTVKGVDFGGRFSPASVNKVDKVATCSYIAFMRSVGIKILKNKLSEYVRLAANGETVFVTDRDRVVAELIPPRQGGDAQLSDVMLEEAFRKGLITPASNPSQPIPATTPIMTFQELLRDLDESRQDR